MVPGGSGDVDKPLGEDLQPFCSAIDTKIHQIAALSLAWTRCGSLREGGAVQAFAGGVPLWRKQPEG
jgi:hypothetical protein